MPALLYGIECQATPSLMKGYCATVSEYRLTWVGKLEELPNRSAGASKLLLSEEDFAELAARTPPLERSEQ